MTMVQQVLLELEMDYIGHPYYVSGNALFHALCADLPYDVHQKLRVSHGIFSPGQFGRYPNEHSQNGVRPYLGSGLPDVKAYDDLFIQRHPDHSWLLDSRPREAVNTHDIRVQGGHPALAPKTIMGRPEDHSKNRQATKWFIHFYIHAEDDDVLPLSDGMLDGLQLGGKRNYGYGQTSLKATQMVNLSSLDYSRLEDADAYLVHLVTPFVLSSEYPGARPMDIPSWWREERDDLRLRVEKVVEQREDFQLVTVDHGQVVEYTGDLPIETAKNGITRVGTHSKYGFGELRVKPLFN